MNRGGVCVRVRGLNGEPGLHLPEEVASLLDLLSAGEKKRENQRERERELQLKISYTKVERFLDRLRSQESLVAGRWGRRSAQKPG